MDANLETPASAVENQNEAKDESSADEDQVLDWSKVATKKGRTNQSLPKRGEKAFEPSTKGTSTYQQFMLENARRAMQDALEEPRQIQVKRLSQGIWQPQFGTVRMLEAKGAGFTHVGCSIRRPGSTEKKLELLPEEALYLVERGSLLCWEQTEGQEIQAEEPEARRGDLLDPVQIIGVPLSVQQSFAVMIGKAGLTFERYQVYAYLRRFGYVVRRSDPPDSLPEWAVYRHPLPHKAGFLSWIWSKWNRLLNMVAARTVNWWKPMCFGLLDRLWGRNLNSKSAFDKLRVIPTRNSSQAFRVAPNSPFASPYRVFYQAWKPSVFWTRQNTPPPDFEIVVINARTTPLPTLGELEGLFATVPFASSTAPTAGQIMRIWSRVQRVWNRNQTPERLAKPVNPFLALKSGKRSVVLAVVDAGTTTMFRFVDGRFEEWPMV